MYEIERAFDPRPIVSWSPRHGDYLIWSGWFSTWYGVLIDHPTSDECVFTVAGLPLLLVDSSRSKAVCRLSTDEIRSSRSGRFAIIRQSYDTQVPIWYV